MSLVSAVQSSLTRGPVQVAPDMCEAEFVFSQNFAGFEGHFPGNPMLPGIAQIIAVQLTIRPDVQPCLKSIGRTKFTSIVRPGDTMLVRAWTKDTEKGLLVQAQCLTHDIVCAQIKLVLDRS